MKKSKFLVAGSAISLVLSIAAPAVAQDAPAAAPTEEEKEEEVVAEEATEEKTSSDIVVTGSRIKKDTYSSISPLQVLTTEAENEAGLFDPSTILQRSESAAGQQIDATFIGFVLDNGPGSQTLNLRGLGADRTLLLVNGRRLAPAGVEGAPTSPSINLLPGSLIDRYDLLLDGASSVYGSDAVAGVGNIVLRKDFDGLELNANGQINPQGSGEDYSISGAWGFNTDRAFFGIGAEYTHRDDIRYKDRKFFQGCDTNYEIDQNGNILTVGKRDNALVQDLNPGISVSENPCTIGGISGRIFIPQTRAGSVYFPANGNIANFPVDPITGRTLNFGDSADAFGDNLDSNGDGKRDVDFQNVNTNGAFPNALFIPQQDLYNVMAYGEYTFPGEANITPFFEANYSRAEIKADNTGSPQIFPYVPGNNAFNPCNFVGNPNGVDCRSSDNAISGLTGGPFALSTGRLIAVQPIFALQGDRDNFDIVQEQYRGVFGVKGDLPFISPSWSFETSAVYSRSDGKSVRRGVREDKLAFALGVDPTRDFNGDGIVDNNGNGIADDYNQNIQFGNSVGGAGAGITPCNAAQLANPTLAMADLLQGCVPVNLFAASVLTGAVGNLATQAERDYIFGERTFNTRYEQLTFAAFATGNLFDLPAGPVGAVVGVEYRKDKINSRPDVIASDGLFFGFFSDQGARGSKTIKEAFGELDIPLQAGKPWVEELNLKLAGRITDEQFYGTNYTYSLAAGWRPIEALQIKFTYGTSFRAPNLRENFLAGQSGFLTLFDPCAVPTAAFSSLGGGYNAALDDRDAVVLANCRREGRDPTRVGIEPGLNTIQNPSVEIKSGGSLDIQPETSRSLTAGFAFEETFGGGFDVSLAFNYFDIKVKDSIVEPSSQFILNDCYGRDDGQRSPFCDRITVDTAPTSRLLVSDVFAGFINLNQESVRGMDFNANFAKDIQMFGTSVGWRLNARANHLMERSSLFINDDGSQAFDEDAGEFSFPKWTGRATLSADIDKFRLSWTTSYTGPVAQDPAGIDPLSDAFGNGPNGPTPGFVGDTCTGGGSANVTGDGIFCRDVGFAKEQFLHSASLRYRTDRYTFLIGVSNIFNTAPPLVDPSEVFSVANTAIGSGYDYNGREVFASVNIEF